MDEPRASADRRARSKTHRRRFALEQFEDRTLLSTFTWAASSAANWSDASSWTKTNINNANTIPGSGDVVIFDGTGAGDSTIDQAFTVKSITISAGTINANASLTVNAGYAQSGGTFNANGQTLTAGPSFAVTGGTFNAGAGTVMFTSGSPSATATVDASGVAFNNVEIAVGGTNLTAMNMAVGGNLKMTYAAKVIGAFTMEGGNNATIDGANFFTGNLVVNKTGGATVSLASNLTTNLSSVAVNSGALNIGQKNLVVGGPMSVASGAKLLFKATGATQLSVAGDLTFASGSLLDVDLSDVSSTFDLIKVTGSGKTLIDNGVNLTATGNPGYELAVVSGTLGKVKVVAIP